MKTLFKSLFIALFAVVACACSDDEPEREKPLPVPYRFYFQVLDSEGSNMLANGEFDVRYPSPTVTYKNTVSKLASKGESRFFTDIFEKDGVNFPVLGYGAFSGDYDNETFEINWGDGTKDVVSFSTDAYLKNFELKINGKESSQFIYTNVVLIKFVK